MSLRIQIPFYIIFIFLLFQLEGQEVKRLKSTCANIWPGEYIIQDLEDLQRYQRFDSIDVECGFAQFQNLDFKKFFLVGYVNHASGCSYVTLKDTLLISDNSIQLQCHIGIRGQCRMAFSIQKWWIISKDHHKKEIVFDTRKTHLTEIKKK